MHHKESQKVTFVEQRISFSVTDVIRTPKTYTGNSIDQVYDEETGGVNRITLQSCINNDVNLIFLLQHNN